MDSHLEYRYRKGFERPGTKRIDGPWEISYRDDPLTEKSYLACMLRSPICSLLDRTTLLLRCRTAHTISPHSCLPVNDIGIGKDRLELFFPAPGFVDPGSVSARESLHLLETIVSTLARFEAYGFFAPDLSLKTVGRNERGEFLLLPNSYVLPFPAGTLEAPGFDPATGLIVPSRIELLVPDRSKGHRGHIEGVKRICSSLAPVIERIGGDAASSFRPRLENLSDALERGVDSWEELYGLLTGKELPRGSRPPFTPPADPSREEALAEAEHTVRLAVEQGERIIVVKGPALGGKTRLLRRLSSWLLETGKWIPSLDTEWDLFFKGRSRRGRTGGPKPRAHLIDDPDERAFVYSDIATAMLQGELPPDTLVVLAITPDRTSGEMEEFLSRLRERRMEGIIEVSLGTQNAASTSDIRLHLESLLGHLHGEIPERPGGEQELMREVLSRLPRQDRQLAEFLAVARFPVPVDMVLSLLPERDGATERAIHRLAALQLVELRYRYAPRLDSVQMFLAMKHNSLARLLYLAIPSSRRRNLSRTIPLLAEEHGDIPPFHHLYHLIKGGEKDLAAGFCLSYFKSHRGKARPLFFTFFANKLVGTGLFETLPFHARLFVLHELASDLVRAGGTGQAEGLLVGAIELVDENEDETCTQHAQLITSISLTLADIWERKGEYRRALTLLGKIKARFQAYLSIADQARLSNDIGWLQYRLGDYEKSIESCKLSLASLNPSQYPLVVAQALNTMGVVHFNTSRYDEAISYYEKSLHLREQAGDPNAVSASYNNLGLVFQTKGEYDTALDFYNRSLEIKMRQGNKPGIAAGYLNLALLYLEMENLTEAQNKCRESLRISNEVGNAPLRAENYSTLGDIALRKGEFEEAEHHYLESLEIFRELSTINEEMGVLIRISRLYLARGKYAEAEKTIEKASSLASRIGSRLESAQIDLILGDLRLEQRRHMQAIEHYDRAAGHFATLSKNELAAAALARIGLIHAEKGNILEARQFMDRADDLIRTEFGHHPPEELGRLQKALQSHPMKKDFPAEISEKIMMAFYELGTLSDCALDRTELFRKSLEIMKEITMPQRCYLAVKCGEKEYELYEHPDRPSRAANEAESLLLDRTLLLGHLLEQGSPDAGDIVSDLDLPPGQGFVTIPLKSMGEDLGCFILLLDGVRLPLSRGEISLFNTVGRHIAGNLRLMFHFEEHLESAGGAHPEPPVRIRSEETYRPENIVAESKQMKEILRTIDKIKNTTPNILFIGESGTGKTVLARTIHYSSPRRDRPFQPIHCAQIPDTLIESELFGHEKGSFTGAYKRKIGLCEKANGGTIFLDDVNAVPVSTQKKLLHFLETKTFNRIGSNETIYSDVRFIAASNEELEELCREGRFREDLYYRLKVIQIRIPPLRERKEDIMAITQAYLRKRCGELGIPLKTLAPDTIRIFLQAPWRGNVRELQNALERIVLLTDENIIYPDSLPEDMLRELSGTDQDRARTLKTLVEEIVNLGSYSESDPLMPQLEVLLARSMVDHIRAKGKAAELLGISKPTLYSRLQRLDRNRKE